MGHKAPRHRAKFSRDFSHIAEIAAELKMEQEASLDRFVRARIKKAEQLTTKKIGRHRYVPSVLEVCMSEDLPSSLRHVGPLRSGRDTTSSTAMATKSIIESLEKRNIIPHKTKDLHGPTKPEVSKGDIYIRREPFGLISDALES